MFLIAISIVANSFIAPITAFADDSNPDMGTQESTIYKTGNYATHYFYNLHGNYGYNVAGSCGYVAAGMLLTFYDLYWNDSFVSRDNNKEYYSQPTYVYQYPSLTVDSPGVISDYELRDHLLGMRILRQDNHGNEYYDYSNYMSYVFENNRSYLHFDLMGVGQHLEYLSPVGSGASDIYQIANVINYYLFETSVYFQHNDTIGTYNANVISGSYNDVALQAASLIDAGNPVILAGYSSEGLAHAMIAYDYRINQDNSIELFVHVGDLDNPNLTHVPLSSTAFTQGICAIQLEHDYSHWCSTAFVNDDGEPICSCMLSIHPLHTHEYAYRRYSSTHHKRICTNCGEYTISAHVVVAGTNTCLRCGMFVSTDTPIIVPGVNSILTGIINYDVTYFTDNGSYILPNGIIILAVEDVQDYLNGTLAIPYVSILSERS